MNPNRISLTRTISAVALSLGLTSGALADVPPNITPEERALLPRWCAYVQGGGGAQHPEVYKAMINRYGDGWTHMHHYCYALVDNMRLDRYSVRNNPSYANWSRAIANIDYVLRSTDTARDFPFRQEALARKARLQMRFSDPAAALATAGQLMAEWPTIPDGYIMVADILLRAGKREQALAILAKGEAAVEDKKGFALQRGMLKLN
ncbi:MAG: hypothetical protein KJZ83_00580 [Burkholderiaceae bacterium]|nr:hypothetical protein [Burkholderiaceae bacterium]